MKKDDNVYLVNPPKKDSIPPLFKLTARGLKYPRVVPLYSEIGIGQYNAVEGKVRGKDMIRVVFTIPTVKLRYKKKIWLEHSQIHIDIPLKKAKQLGLDLVKFSDKYLRG